MLTIMGKAQVTQVFIVVMDLVSFILDLIIILQSGSDYSKLALGLLSFHAVTDFLGIFFNSLVHCLYTHYEQEKEYKLAVLSQMVSFGICLMCSILTPLCYESYPLPVWLLIRSAHYVLKLVIFEKIKSMFK